MVCCVVSCYKLFRNEYNNYSVASIFINVYILILIYSQVKIIPSGIYSGWRIIPCIEYTVLYIFSIIYIIPIEEYTHVELFHLEYILGGELFRLQYILK